MERLRKTLTALLIGISISAFAQQTGDNLYSLTVNVDELHSNNGILQFSLYNEDGCFPDEHFKRYYKQLKAKINNNASTITFENIPEGTYAVNIFHDENNNGVIDKGWILPVEGLGFSNFTALNLFNRPNYKKAKFVLKSNKTIKIKIIHM